jgi:hypothetical protein
MVPRLYGESSPQSIVTSWAHVNFFSLGVGRTSPSFFHGDLGFCGSLKIFGFDLDDCAVVWKTADAMGDKAVDGTGYCIRGKLHPETWRKMMEELSHE